MRDYTTVYVLDHDGSIFGVYPTESAAIAAMCEAEWEGYQNYPCNYEQDLIKAFKDTNVTKAQFFIMVSNLYEIGDINWGIVETEYWNKE